MNPNHRGLLPRSTPFGGPSGGLRSPSDARDLPTDKCNPLAFVGTQVGLRTRFLGLLGIQCAIPLVCGAGYMNTATISAISPGCRATRTPAPERAAILSAAVPFPPLMMAPA